MDYGRSAISPASKRSSARWQNWRCGKENNNQTHDARLLDISHGALGYKLKKFELVPAGEDDSSDPVPSENASGGRSQFSGPRDSHLAAHCIVAVTVVKIGWLADVSGVK